MGLSLRLQICAAVYIDPNSRKLDVKLIAYLHYCDKSSDSMLNMLVGFHCNTNSVHVTLQTILTLLCPKYPDVENVI